MSKQKSNWKNKQFKNRFLNDPLRIKQFKLDEKFFQKNLLNQRNYQILNAQPQNSLYI